MECEKQKILSRDSEMFLLSQEVITRFLRFMLTQEYQTYFLPVKLNIGSPHRHQATLRAPKQGLQSPMATP